jgi:hypothetical protein
MRALVLLVVLGLAAPAWAQESAQDPSPAPAPAIDVIKLGVDLSRIQKGLRFAETKDQEMRDGLRVAFNVQVYGVAPPIQIWTEADRYNGHVPGTAPSHRQMIEQMTPPIYRQPGVDFLGLAIMGAVKLVEMGKKAQCEEDLRAYRELLMQGVNVAAPRCTQ